MVGEGGTVREGADWTALSGALEHSEAVQQQVAAWRRAHPRATLTEIEQAVEQATRQLGYWLVATLAEGEASPPERPRCPQCQTPMERRGRKPCDLLVAHQPQPLQLERAYYVCPACGAGLSPPR